MAALESQLVISADDRTAAAFAAVQGRLTQLQSVMAALDRGATPALANAGAFAGPSAALQEHADAVSRATTAISNQADAIEAATPLLTVASSTLLKSMGAAGVALEAAKIGSAAITQAVDQQHEAIRMQTAGMTPLEIEDAQELSADIAREYPSIQQSDALALARNVRSIVGSYDEAAKLMQDIAQLYVVSQGSNAGAPAEERTHDFEALLKGLEIKGATQNPEEFQHMMEGIARGLNAFGDTLKPDDYYQMIKYARQAGLTLSDDFLVGVAPSIAQAMRGSSAGRAFSDFNRAIVGGHMEHAGYAELLSLGLLRESDVQRTKTGEIKGLAPGAHVAGSAEAAANPYQWVQDYVMPALKAQGITTSEAIAEHIGRFFSNQYAAQLGLIFATQQSRIEKDLAVERQAKGLEAAKTFSEQDIRTAGLGLWNAIKTDAWGLTGGLVPTELIAKAAHDTSQILLTPGPSTAGSAEDLYHQLFGRMLTDRNRSELMERYGLGAFPTVEDIMRAPSRHALGESYRIESEMEADREAARGAALMAMPSEADREAARKLSSASQINVAPAMTDAQRSMTSPETIIAMPVTPQAPQSVSVNGSAEVSQTINLQVTLDPRLQAQLDQITNGMDFTVPLVAPTGRMDTDAAPNRGGIGAM